DNGLSYGPFQLYTHGALPKGKNAAWANSPAGVDYAIRKMAEAGAAGLTGQEAIDAIVRKFERPANPDASVANATKRYADPRFRQTLLSGLGKGAVESTVIGIDGTRRIDPQSFAMNDSVRDVALQSLNKVASGQFDFVGLLGELAAAKNANQLTQRAGAMPQAAGPAAAALSMNGAPATDPVTGYALDQLGTPYSWGGGTTKGPSEGFGRGKGIVGFDCSSLVQAAWARAGVNIPRTTYEQIKVGQAVKGLGAARPGDLLFPHPGHVMMYLGNGKAVEAPFTGGKVRVVDATKRDYVAIRRPGG
ncbi:MAG: NlpC/P60 family protein, partial [Leptolyngbyaceae bacterium]|nr:NlpC/P60 family protein [Leptolyngbyaceae bacterium]